MNEEEEKEIMETPTLHRSNTDDTFKVVPSQSIWDKYDKENQKLAASIDISSLLAKHGNRVLEVDKKGQVIIDPKNPVHDVWLNDK
ncbi:hypothetical protein [Paenisporosarcina sp. TG20]|uniref:hypothetical protein n=1 Tax=Paenisporosarcina sp. TG20 TaxID=1211706 RepID=UPI0003043B25|nr:hypothetical protein [Paenisporosarcina sp. TG20]